MGDDNATEGYLTSEYAPPIHPSPFYWRKPSGSRKGVNGSLELIRAVENERSVFIGCLPEGVENMQEVLQDLMEKFLARFDFAPSILSQVCGVKIVKDYAFVEFALDGVAQIVLAANQIDAFEWVVRGVLFNIEGCNGTYTSVRPLVEFLPLKPARVILIGNIPEIHWEEEYLRSFFCKILQGSDESLDMKVVVAVHLIPESFDAYLELVSECIADAVVYKCTKNSDILKSIGEDTFICRHTNLIPLMSKYTSSICPQRALFVGISYGGEKFKIEGIRKIFEEVLLTISRKSNYHGYIEYISVQPGTDYAFFQFDSEAITDAIMDEYIENTQLFSGTGGSISYIILRPPDYIRPGTKYRSDIRQKHFDRSGEEFNQHGNNEAQSKQACWMQTEKNRRVHVTKHGHEAGGDLNIRSDEYMNRAASYKRAGSDAGKKADVVMSVGSINLQPSDDWQGRSSAIDYSFDSESVIVVEGMPLVRGLGYKLLRGALNELFERALSNSGLLQIGMHVLRYLDRDPENANVVACLPNIEFADALLSSRKSFILSGKELRLLPNDTRKLSHRRQITSSLTDDGDEMSCFGDDGDQGKVFLRGVPVEERTACTFSRQRKRPRMHFDSHYHFNYHSPERDLNTVSVRNGSVERTPPPVSQRRKRLCRETDSRYDLKYETSERERSILPNHTDLSMPALYNSRGLRSASSENSGREFIRRQFKEGLQRTHGASELNSDLNGPRRKKSSLLIAERIRRQGNIRRGGVFQNNEGAKFFKRENSYIPSQNKNVGENLKRSYVDDNVNKFAVPRRNSRAGDGLYSSERGRHFRKNSEERAHETQRLRSQVVRDRIVENLRPGQGRHRKHHRYEGKGLFMRNRSPSMLDCNHR